MCFEKVFKSSLRFKFMKIKRKKGLKHTRIHHNKKLLWVIGFLVLVLIVVVIFLRQEITKRDSLIIGGENNTQIANPASEYCISLGGELELTESSQGSVGMCTLSSGEVCEEWALFRGECGDLRDTCSGDGDCVKVQTGCCSCSMGGEEICINKEYQSLYDFGDKCSNRTICSAVYMCKESSCTCINGKCRF